ncbi:MAG TPA: amino acid adenylation domain-containing protein, partial [Thermoanaerobaculia bacterium]|nr:amino acid adenylation domain-containing protein [Thermoanaerobaculia bacterium]
MNARANRLAHGLRRRGVGPEALVGICVGRSLSMVVTALGVLKAGGGLVALDPSYPLERLATIVEDAGLSVLLCDQSLLAQFPRHRAIALVLDEQADLLAGESEAEPVSGVCPDHPMYAIYTSGSTGRPKGIVVTHRAFANFLGWQLCSSGWEPVRTVQFATFGFCVSFQEIFSAWCSGGTLIVAGEMTRRDLGVFGDFLASRGIERLHLPYAALKHLAESSRGAAVAPAPLREVITAGEPLKVTRSVRELFAALPGCTLANQYGASETHVISALTLSGAAASWPALPAVGRAIANVRIHLLDERLIPVPIGVRGELYAGGACVPRCYLNDAALTAWKLVPDPYGLQPGGRLYRTGDLGRRLADGRIESLGRIDGQVKVRGFRVETGEVETVLARDARVRDVAVVPRGVGEELRLVAYLVPASAGGLEAGLVASLRQALQRLLPEYMVPASFVVLSELPVNANGKLDVAALPAPEASRSGALYRPARTPVEEVLAALWQEVLGVERVGLDDGFFDLGGHSLLATQVMSRVRSSLGVDLPLRALFESPSVAGLAQKIEALRGQGRALQAPPLVPVARDGELPLSFAQQRLWFIDQLEPGSALYNISIPLRAWGALAAGALARALGEVVRRHEALRTVFAAAEGRARQVILQPAEFTLPVVDLSGLTAERREEMARALAAAESARPFDLASGPLFRTALLRLAAGVDAGGGAKGSAEHVVLLTLHHIVGDGWSLGVLMREVAALYEAFAAGRPSPLPELAVQYADFAVWQRGWMAGEVLESELAYWRERLAGAPPVLDLPADRVRPAVQSFRGAAHELALAPALASELAALARRSGATLFMTLLAGLQGLLARLSGQEDMTVGTPIAGRNRLETEELIGFFVNTLVMRADLSGRPSFAEHLARVRSETLSAYAHQDLPFERLVEELAPERSLAHAPLFKVMLELQNAPLGDLALAGLALSPFEQQTGTAKFDLTLRLRETAAGLAGLAEYSRDLFDSTTVQRLTSQLERLLAAAAADPHSPVAELDLLGAAERHQLLVEWNDRAAHYEKEGTLHGASLARLFAQQVARTPAAPAVLVPARAAAEGPGASEPGGGERAASAEPGGAWLSYAELDDHAERLAARLRTLGVGPEVTVGLCTERSPALAVATLGIVKAGGAYVPLDPDYPAERLAAMLEDSAAQALVTQPSLLGALPAFTGTVVLLDELARTPPAASAAPDRHGGDDASSDHLGYVMFTSGSTGRPKGIAVPQRAVSRLVRGSNYLQIAPGERIAQLSNPSFDAATFELWGALLNGACLVFIPRDVSLAPRELAAHLAACRVDALFLTTALFNQVARERPDAFRTLRCVLFGGEAVDPTAVREVLAAGPPQRLLHVYGPTESTTFATYQPVAAVPPDALTVPIGRPLANTRLYVTGRDLMPLPVGVPGELLIGGDGLARGYLAHPALTAERFVPDPFGPPGARLYRTGDRVRTTPSGALEFLGRFDHQVKLRGFRIELGEVEAALAAHPTVREAAVLLREDRPADRRLVAYVVARGPRPSDPDGIAPPPAEISTSELRAFLAARLPAFMVPAAFVPLPRLPLTPNGKVDRAALPLPETRTALAAAAAPRNPIEELLAGLFRDLLEIDRVGIHDSFFELGGHSLLATQLISRLRSTVEVELPLAAAFAAPTVAALAELVEQTLRGGQPLAPPILPVPRQPPPPLSFAQERLWLLDRLRPGLPLYNVPLALHLAGRLDVAALERALATLVRRHEALRTTFLLDGDQPVQRIAPPEPAPPRSRRPPTATADGAWLPLVDLGTLASPRSLAAAVLDEQAHRSFDLESGPLLRLLLLRLAERQHVLLLALHHIVCDGWSLSVLTRELAALYAAALTPGGPPDPLPALTVQYADFAVWQRRWLAAAPAAAGGFPGSAAGSLPGEALAVHLAYWQQQLAGAPEAIQLPTDRLRPAARRLRGATRAVTLPAATAHLALAFGRSAQATLFMTLVTAWAALLSRYSGQPDLTVGFPIANRNRAEIEGLVGFFVNTLVLRAGFAGNPGFGQALERVRQATLGAYLHQDLPFEKLVELLRPERRLDVNPLFQVLFALQNQPAPELTLPGLVVTPLALDSGTAKFELTLSLQQEGAAITGTLEYDADLFDGATAGRLLEHYQSLLEHGLTAPEQGLDALPLLSPAAGRQLVARRPRRAESAAWQQLVVEWNDTAASLPHGASLARLFAQQVARTPAAPAVLVPARAAAEGPGASEPGGGER